MTSEVEKENDLADAGEEVTSGSQVKKQEISWQAGDYFVWPVNGNVLIPYSMDKTVYFATLDQYKYSRAMVLAAEEGTTVYASTSGTVESVYTDAEIGNAVKLNIGGGYEVVYGQLKDIQVKEGGYVEKGSVIGTVAAPTKYYSAEGANIYCELLHDGAAVDPMGALQ